MTHYNLAGEYAMLFIIFIILLSFSQDYAEKNFIGRTIGSVFVLNFITTIFTICSMEIERVIFWKHYVPWAYFFNIVYFATIPIITTLYLFLCFVIATPKIDNAKIIHCAKLSFTPYITYVFSFLFMLWGGYVFTIDETYGYTRLEWYRIPYVIAIINIVLIIYVVVRNRKVIHKNTIRAILANMLIASVLLYLQSVFSTTIMTSLSNTTSVLALYLFTQNKRKTVDTLTNTNNVVALRRRVDELIQKNADFSIYVFSFRGFKSINERNGLDFGDAVLKTFSNELLDFEFINYDNLYRYSGDEFAILLHASDDNEKNIQSVITYFKKPFNIQDIDTVQLDLVCARVDNKLFGDSTKELISALDFSTSQLKLSHGEPRYLYDTAVVKSIIEKTNMIRQIKDAIDNRMFQIYYQPMYSTKDGAFTQAEALVRMKDGEGGLIPPYKFIDIAETTGLIVPMTSVILDIVCEDFRKLIENYGDDVSLKSIAVNFPYHFFLSPTVEDDVMAILNKHNLKPSHIKIEITERTFIANENVIKQVMERMRTLGFIFELDDFGVDYSNMSTFMNLPIQIIKIDRSVLLSAMDNESNMQFFQHLIIGINATGRIIVVEGVEEKTQLDFILSCECEFIQGYIFSKPLCFTDFMQFILPKSQKKLLAQFT